MDSEADAGKSASAGKVAALRELVPYVPQLQQEGVFQELLAEALQETDNCTKSKALAALIPALPESRRLPVLCQAVEAAGATTDPIRQMDANDHRVAAQEI